jgi:hypothetical protein
VREGVWRRDIGLGCALAHGHDDAGVGEHRYVVRTSIHFAATIAIVATLLIVVLLKPKSRK